MTFALRVLAQVIGKDGFDYRSPDPSKCTIVQYDYVFLPRAWDRPFLVPHTKVPATTLVTWKQWAAMLVALGVPDPQFLYDDIAYDNILNAIKEKAIPRCLIGKKRAGAGWSPVASEFHPNYFFMLRVPDVRDSIAKQHPDFEAKYPNASLFESLLGDDVILTEAMSVASSPLKPGTPSTGGESAHLAQVAAGLRRGAARGVGSPMDDEEVDSSDEVRCVRACVRACACGQPALTPSYCVLTG